MERRVGSQPATAGVRRGHPGPRRPGPRARAAAALALVVALQAGVAAAGQATAAGVDSAANPARPPAALLVFISSQSTFDLPLPPVRMRADVARSLGEALRPRGLDLLEPTATQELQRRWRVRSGLALDPAFLSALAAQTGSRTLLVAQVIDSPERVVLDARWLELASGKLLWAGVAEAEIPEAPASPATRAARADTVARVGNWQAGLRAAAGRLAAAWRDAPSRPDAAPLLVLPAAGIGVDAWQTDVVTHCLLRDLLVERRAAVLDPGVLVACVEADGHDPTTLDATSLRKLGERFGSTAALLSDLISYAPVPRHADALSPPPEETAGPSPVIAADLALAVRRFDTHAASITAAADVFVPAPPPAGWFGRPIRFSPLSQLDTACKRLLADGRAVPED